MPEARDNEGAKLSGCAVAVDIYDEPRDGFDPCDEGGGQAATIPTDQLDSPHSSDEF